MFWYDIKRDGPATLVILAIVAVALAILNFRLSRAQIQNQVVKAKYELQALAQAMDAYSFENPQTQFLDAILKTKKEGNGYFHQGYLVQSASPSASAQLIPKNSLDGYLFPKPYPQMPLKQKGEDYPHEKFYGVISAAGKQWRLDAQHSKNPPQCASLGDHNMAESSFHLRFEWPQECLNDGDEITAISPGPFVDYTLIEDKFVEYDSTNGLNSRGFIYLRQN